MKNIRNRFIYKQDSIVEGTTATIEIISNIIHLYVEVFNVVFTVIEVGFHVVVAFLVFFLSSHWFPTPTLVFRVPIVVCHVLCHFCVENPVFLLAGLCGTIIVYNKERFVPKLGDSAVVKSNPLAPLKNPSHVFLGSLTRLGH